jgi:signal transduction histidine kinase
VAEPVGSTNAILLWETFLEAETSAEARSNGELRRLCLDGSPTDQLLETVRLDGRVPTESGSPLAVPGLARLVERLPEDDARVLALAPLWASTLTSRLLTRILDRPGQSWPQLREAYRRERSRIERIQEQMARVGGRGPVHSSMWIDATNARFFAWALLPATSSKAADGSSALPPFVAFVPEPVFREALAQWILGNGPGRDSPFGLEIQLEGVPVAWSAPSGSGTLGLKRLASASGTLANPWPLKSALKIKPGRPSVNAIPIQAKPAGRLSFDAPLPAIRPADLTVSAFMVDPSALYARARFRALLMGAVTLGAAAAAALGFVLSRRAFHLQLALNEEKSNFVSAVSHELRAPIAAVRLMTENLTRGAPAEPERQQEYFRLILQECRRLSSLIENVLDYSRIEQDRKEYDMEPTDLGSLVAATARLMEPIAADHAVGIRVVCSRRGDEAEAAPPDEPNVRLPTPASTAVCDGRALQQALVNLIDNAIKHSPAGTDVAVELRQEATAFLVSVTDHGPGIPPEERRKVFDRFYRRDSELRRETQGVGIGLGIVQSIVEAHQGRVWMEAAPGGGCRAVIELPATPSGEESRKS